MCPTRKITIALPPPVLDIAAMFNDQYAFNKVVLKDAGYDIDNLSERELNDLLVSIVTHVTEECHEVLRELNWKIHKTKEFKPLNMAKILEEIVDANKFLFTLVTYMGISPTEYSKEWDRKTQVVWNRWREAKAKEKNDDSNL